MSTVPHFSISSLPERFRAQVMHELGTDRQTGTSGHPGRIVCVPTEKKKQRLRRRGAPVRMAAASTTSGGNGRGGGVGGGGGGNVRIGLCDDGGMGGRGGRVPNETERAFNAAILDGKGRYEPMTLHLSGGNYTPDFMTFGIPVHTPETEKEQGPLWAEQVPILYEVKGSYHLPTHGRSVFAFKQACAEYTGFVFVFAEKTPGGKSAAWNVGVYHAGRMLATVCGTPDDVRNTMREAMSDLLKGGAK